MSTDLSAAVSVAILHATLALVAVLAHKIVDRQTEMVAILSSTAPGSRSSPEAFSMDISPSLSMNLLKTPWSSGLVFVDSLTGWILQKADAVHHPIPQSAMYSTRMHECYVPTGL